MQIEKDSLTYTCPLCLSSAKNFYNQQFQQCSACQSIFRCAEFFLSAEEEKFRYQEHNNDVEDNRYQKFVSPIVEKVLENHTTQEKGLDFGAGTGPVISHILEKKGFQLSLYDPFFHKQPKFLEQTYDFIIVCEVVEHFCDPKKEFQLLYGLLKPKGKLYIMTDLYSPEIDFHQWHYKNDKTHVFFYSDQSFKWIRDYWGFVKYTRENRCIIFEK